MNILTLLPKNGNNEHLLCYHTNGNYEKTLFTFLHTSFWTWNNILVELQLFICKQIQCFTEAVLTFS